jgi:hypothetical protein
MRGGAPQRLLDGPGARLMLAATTVSHPGQARSVFFIGRLAA